MDESLSVMNEILEPNEKKEELKKENNRTQSQERIETKRKQ